MTKLPIKLGAYRRKRVLAAALPLMFSGLAQAGDPAAAIVGEWSDVQPWPVVAVHASLMGNGKVIAWDATPDDFDDDPHTTDVKTTRITVWDPATNTHVQADNNTNTDLFCAGSAHLWDGDILFAGGDDYPGGAPGNLEGATANSNIFHPTDNSWTRLENMASARWYATTAALPNGEMLTFGGNYQVEPFAEVLGLDRRWRPLPIGPQMPYPYSGDYQWLQVAPDGRVASFGPHNALAKLDTASTGLWESVSERDDVPYRAYGSFAPYRLGKIIVTGGLGFFAEGAFSQSSAVLLDLNTMSAEPTNDMLYQRAQHNLTVLPDGQVLATGGHNGTETLVNMAESVLPSEMWNPDTGEWTEMAPLSRTRQYHSIALLLPDGRVVVAGGGYCGACSVANYHEQNAEIYSPPYLFDANGDLAPKPQLTDVPARLNYGSSFSVDVQSDLDISSVVMIKPGSTTHSHNQDQRFINLTFETTVDGISVIAPANRNLAPPGDYMLFVLDENGVPSHGEFIMVGQPLLTAGQAVAQSVPKDDLDVYAIESSADDPSLVITVDGIVGDADLYIRAGQYPNGFADDEYDCGSAQFGQSTEVCLIDNPGDQTWYIGVKGWAASDYQLKIATQADGTELPGEIDPAKRDTNTTDDSDGGDDEGESSSSGGGGAFGVLLTLLLGLRFAFLPVRANT